jgi:hypothetical protein
LAAAKGVSKEASIVAADERRSAAPDADAGPSHGSLGWFRTNGYRPVLAVLLLAAITVWVFHLQLFDGWSFPWDFLGTYTTTPAFVAATIGRGHLLSWSPFVASGFPVDVDPQAGMYFPGWWLLGVLRVPATLRVLTTVQVAHVLFGSIGILALARARRLAWPWATVAAVAYIFFGGFYGQAEHADIFRGFAYLPWLLWALTPPDDQGRWTRLVALPPLAWLIVSGAYPGEVVSFGITGLVYVSVALKASGADTWRRYRRALALAILASAAVCVAVLLPYIRAEQANELYRTVEPTAAIRNTFAISPLDFFGLYLNNFAWTYEGTITAWAIGVPILVGVACARRDTLRGHAPLIACGAVALVLGMTPKIGFIGRAMVSAHFLFPSRFPASDYKAVVAIALIIVSADAWGRLAARRHGRPWMRIGLSACVLIGGALLVPRTHAQPTREIWLLMVVVLASGALALTRPPVRVLACLLIVLVVVDGLREINDYRLGGVVSPWHVPPSALAFYRERNVYVRDLPKRLEEPVKSRPARVPAAATAEPNASGWVADAYHETDYDPTFERSLWEAENNPAWSSLLLDPWHGYVFSCASVGCVSGAVRLPPPSTWRASPDVQTLSYGDQRITYTVNISKPVLMVENELSVDGWRADTSKVKLVDAGIPLRAWRLAPGHYKFVAYFQEPDRTLQELAAVLALIAWLGCVLLIRRSNRSVSRRPLPSV